MEIVKILIVEDDIGFAYLVQHQLTNLGFQSQFILTVHTLEDARLAHLEFEIERLKEIMKKRRGEKEMIPLEGGRAALKKGSKFPDHSGDGKITQKDILMAKGIIPKKKKKGKK